MGFGSGRREFQIALGRRLLQPTIIAEHIEQQEADGPLVLGTQSNIVTTRRQLQIYAVYYL